MATISIAGTIVCKEGTSPVSVKTFDSGDQIATFTVMDRAYVYVKPGDEKTGQFYNCQLRGKQAEIASERIKRGDKIAVTGQLVQREYQGKVYLDIRNANPTYLEYRPTDDKSEMPF